MRILVSGAGAAGLSAGIDLARVGHEVEIVERANHLRVNGSPIDVRGAAIETARSMGILDAVIDHRITMTEETKFVDRSGVAVAPLVREEVDESPEDIEIPREDLMNILRQALPEQVDLRFEDFIVSLVDDGDRVAVTYASGREAAYDMVVGADGVHSGVRRLVFGPEEEFTEHLGMYVAIGDAPEQATPDNRTTEVLNLPGRMAGVARYRDKALALFEFRSESIDYDYHDLDEQKRILAEAFSRHRGLEGPRAGQDRPGRPRALLRRDHSDPHADLAPGARRADRGRRALRDLDGRARHLAGPARGLDAHRGARTSRRRPRGDLQRLRAAPAPARDGSPGVRFRRGRHRAPRHVGGHRRAQRPAERGAAAVGCRPWPRTDIHKNRHAARVGAPPGCGAGSLRPPPN